MSFEDRIEQWAAGHREWLRTAFAPCGHHEMYTGRNGCVSCEAESKYLTYEDALAEAYPTPVAPVREDLLADEGREVLLTNGARTRRPLWDVAGLGPANERYAARRASYATFGRMHVDELGEALLAIAVPTAGGKGRQRAAAIRPIAATYGVDITYAGPFELEAKGLADDVARFAAGLGRILDYAEAITTIVMTRYGKWSRSERAESSLAGLSPAELRAAARAYRVEAYTTIVAVLTGPEGAPTPTFDEALPFGEQPAAYAAAEAEYGWVEVFEAYDPDEARAILAGAEVAGPVVVIPCSGPKLAEAAPAGDIYTGSLHVAARKAADKLTAGGGRIVVLSALHGFLSLEQVIDPYDHTWRDAGAVSEQRLAEQAHELGIAGAGRVVLLTPGEYTKRSLTVWPAAATPLAHLGIGSQKGRLKALREGRATVAPASGERALVAA